MDAYAAKPRDDRSQTWHTGTCEFQVLAKPPDDKPQVWHTCTYGSPSLWSLIVSYSFYLNFLILFLIRQPPAFPYRLQYSIIGRPGLNHRVRDENGCLPWAHRHRNIRDALASAHRLEYVRGKLPFLSTFS